MVRELARLALDRVERLESERLAWGLVDGGFTRSELIELIDGVLDAEEEQGREVLVTANEVLSTLLEEVLVWRTPESAERYRSRSAEAVRLFARLRQMFKPEQWRSGPSLVSDFRYQVSARRFPRREISAEDVESRLEGAVDLSENQVEALRLILQPDSDRPLQLSEFQAEAAEALLTGFASGKIGATVIAAGTGAGKTLAFFLPTVLRLIEERSDHPFTNSIAVYPRNELLKDQLRASVERLLPLHDRLTGIRGKSISIGALFGSVPKDAAGVTHEEWGWDQKGVGYVCPFLRCPSPDCDGDMVWTRGDLEAGRHVLHCSSPNCATQIPQGMMCLTRQALSESPPDILFTSTEMVNRSMSDPALGRLIGVGTWGAPRVLVLDEIHTYTGIHGAQVAMLLRRWRRTARAKPHVIGLSATLADATRFMSELTGVFENHVRVVEPSPAHMETKGAEYTLALRGDPVSATSLLSTTIQATMLAGRILDNDRKPVSDSVFGSKVFVFGDDLDVINRLHDDLADAEGTGWRSRTRSLGSLANLRSPALEPSLERWRAGQGWDITTDIQHPVNNGSRRRIGRVSSQDSGMDGGVSTIVATASLEVGFDDPAVGAVVQHKAPRDSASYIQRRGRAGRPQVMRPWTIVVLSDYGRDRLAYQRYEDLFSPVVTARYLPIHNPFVLKMQATFALMDWLNAEVPPPNGRSVYRLLAKPDRRAASWYRDVADLLRNVLQDSEGEAVLSGHLQSVLEIDEQQVGRVLWSAPRSLMLEVLPTIVRRAETAWHGEAPVGRPPHPLPEFLPTALFADLNLPELIIHLPGGRQERMPFRQGLGEFAPGRVSRRFGFEREGLSHWMPVPFESDLEVVELSDSIDLRTAWDLGHFNYTTDGAHKAIRVLRPRAVTVATPEPRIATTSNAFLVWQTEVIERADGRRVRLPPAAAERCLIQSVHGFLHGRGAPVEMRRFATGVDAETRLKGSGGSAPPRRYRFVVDGDSVGIGYAQPVDALRFTLALPEALHQRCPRDHFLMRHLRILRFREVVERDERIRGVANHFQVGWVCDAVTSTLARGVLDSERAVSEAADDRDLMNPKSWIETLAVIFDASDDPHLDPGETSDEGSDGEDQNSDDTSEDGSTPTIRSGKRFNELQALLSDPRVQAVVRDALPILHEDIGDSWEPWLTRVVHETMGAALLSATQSLVREMTADELRVDILNTNVGENESADGECFHIWISEDTPGGAGMVERVEAMIQADPQRFLALLESALEASDAEQARVDLGQVSSWLAPSGSDHQPPVADAASKLRNADSHAEEFEALDAFKAALQNAGMFLHPRTMSAVNLRLLRPGSNDRTDTLYHHLYSAWDAAEEALGFEINPRVFAEIMSRDESIDESLAAITEGEGPKNRESWRFSVLNGLLWPSRGTLRAEGLRYFNPFADRPKCDRLIATGLMEGDTPTVDVAQDEWRDALTAVVRRLGAADLVGSEGGGSDLRAALLSLATVPLDVGVLSVYPRVRGFSVKAGQPAVRIEVPELFGVPTDE